ncbi:hypothetical protein llap_21863 [Limosa lapponica baueri]|uniref:Ig-like domain-containing protein n=1 Tax=Limosa lapponica baueri TaxID=1758121 RepID=A0A2I0T208_LIMLA|nr:hypothetical protein llap_21863 [Limosa lapponica baueri]
MDVTVGESVVLPCQVQHDPILDISFTWYFNGTLTDFKKDASHFEKVGGIFLLCWREIIHGPSLLHIILYSRPEVLQVPTAVSVPDPT